MSRNPDAAPPPLLDIDDASVWRGTRRALEHFSLRIEAGQHTAILGPNGSGKSTLVQLIARQLHAEARPHGPPPVRVMGRERWHLTELRGLLGIVSPALERDYTTDAPVEVFDAVVSAFFAARGLGLDQIATPAMQARARTALERLDAGGLVGRTLDSLSSGEARRVLIARALVHEPRALLLDEPCAGLDPASRRRFLKTLDALARAGTTLVLVTHHVEEIVPAIDRVLLLRAGRVLRHGPKAATLVPDLLGAAFDMPVALTERAGWYHAAFG